ncbi:MAG TPA: hypothetical protein ENI27_04850 [bacterium]|nr:hypothetical protein [bacterium]
MKWLMRRFKGWMLGMGYDFGIDHCEALLRGECWDPIHPPLDRFDNTLKEVLGKDWLEKQRKNFKY